MYSRILLATDLSNVSMLMIEHIPNLIPIGLKEILLVHVVDIRHAGGLARKLEAHDHERLEKERMLLAGYGLEVSVSTPIGIPSCEIKEIAEKERVSLVMIGSHGVGISQKLILGSTSEEVIRDAKRPVLIMKVDMKKGEGCSFACDNVFRTILYPTDFSNNAEKVLPYIKNSVDAGCEKVVLLHVQEERRIKPHLEHRLEEFNKIDQDRLDRIKVELLDLGVKEVKTMIKLGKTIPIILSVSEEEDACLIALGSRGRTLLEEVFIGSTANNIVRYARKPVLFVT